MRLLFFLSKKVELLDVVETNLNVIDKPEHVKVVTVHVRANRKSCTSSDAGGVICSRKDFRLHLGRLIDLVTIDREDVDGNGMVGDQGRSRVHVM